MAKTQLIHHVFFWLNNPGSPADRAKLIEGLETLRAVETIKEFHIGVPAATTKHDNLDDSWDVSEMMVFDSLEGEAIYQPHPLHLAFIANYGHLWRKVLVYDAINP